MAINGNNVLIYRNGTAIAGTISNEIQTGAELIEISSPTSGQWKEYIAGRKSWSVNVSYLILANNGVRDLLNVGSSYTLKIRGRNATDATGARESEPQANDDRLRRSHGRRSCVGRMNNKQLC